MLEGFQVGVPRWVKMKVPKAIPYVKGERIQMAKGRVSAEVELLYHENGDLIFKTVPWHARGLSAKLKLMGGMYCGGNKWKGQEPRYNFKCNWIKDSDAVDFQMQDMVVGVESPYNYYDQLLAVMPHPSNDHKVIGSDLNCYEYFVKKYADLGLEPVYHLPKNRPLKAHQVEMVRDMVSHRGAVEAADMGTGKTLAWISGTELLIGAGKLKPNTDDIWYIGPVAGVNAVRREIKKWEAKFFPNFMTYNKMVKTVQNWEVDKAAPKMVCFDESSSIKNPTSQRGRDAKHLADSMRAEYGYGCHVVELSGTPAPNNPSDWYHQCDVAEPGFVMEGSRDAFKNRLCLIKQVDTGYACYPELVTWWDDADKCKNCGHNTYDRKNHKGKVIKACCCGKYSPSVNEVERIFNRFKGLVRVTLKEDVLELPPIQYEQVRIKPPIEMLQAAQTIKNTSERAVTALSLLRELSDGFLYTDEIIGQDECPQCWGSGTVDDFVPAEGFDVNGSQDQMEFVPVEMQCKCCKGKGWVNKYKRSEELMGSPKDDQLKEDLEELDGIGRVIVWAGFTGTIDRLNKLLQDQGWSVLCIDGRGVRGFDENGESLDIDDLQDAMDAGHPDYKILKMRFPKLAVLAHPKAAGMAYTFTAAPMAIYYSNVFDGEARYQSEARNNRMGFPYMASIIKDYILLKTDKLVLENLKGKKKLLNMTMERLNDAFTE